MSKKVQSALILLAQIAGIGLSCGFYSGILGEQVCLLKELIRKCFQDSTIRRFIWADKTNPPIKPDDMVIFLDFTSPSLFKYVILVFVIFVSCEIICLILFVLILKNLRLYSHTFSRTTHRLNFQFTILLGCQLLSPIIYIFFPVFIGIAATLFSFKPTKILVDISFLGIAFYGLSNSYLTIGFISPYRKHFLNFFIFPWLRPLLKMVGFKISSTSTSTSTFIRVNVIQPTIVVRNTCY